MDEDRAAILSLQREENQQKLTDAKNAFQKVDKEIEAASLIEKEILQLIKQTEPGNQREPLTQAFSEKLKELVLLRESQNFLRNEIKNFEQAADALTAQFNALKINPNNKEIRNLQKLREFVCNIVPSDQSLKKHINHHGKDDEALFQDHLEPGTYGGDLHCTLFSPALRQLWFETFHLEPEALSLEDYQAASELAKAFWTIKIRTEQESQGLQESVDQILPPYLRAGDLAPGSTYKKQFQPLKEKRNALDGMILDNNGKPILLIEYKRESIYATLQVMLYYAQTLAARFSDDQLTKENFPVILLSVVGCELLINAAVLVNGKVLVDPLIRLPMYSAQYDPDLTFMQARILRALKNGCLALANENKNNPRVARFPFFPNFSNGAGFWITQFTGSVENKPHVYLAKITKKQEKDAAPIEQEKDAAPIEQEVIIKFSHTYNPDIHRALAECGLAPQLLYFGELRPFWKVVVMEKVNGRPWNEGAKGEIFEALKEKLEKVLEILKENEWVHGDLRSPNILVEGQDLRILDFDFAGKDGKVFYPWNIDPGAFWGIAEGRNKITSSHDQELVKRLLQKVK